MMTPDSSEPETEYTPTPTYATVAKTQERVRARKFQHLRETLLSTSQSSEPQSPTPIATLAPLLSDPSLDLSDLRNLFGALRKTFLLALWEIRQVQLWIKRAGHLGVEYAMSVAEEESVAKYPSRYVFFREMDEGLEVEGGDGGGVGGAEREEVVKLILRHVEVLRETVEAVRGRREVMEGLLRGWEGSGHV